LASNEHANNGSVSGDFSGKNDVEQLLNKDRKEPHKLLYQNIRGLVTKKREIDYLKEYVHENKIMVMNFTEPWLDDSIRKITDIKGYQIWRGDRKWREREEAHLSIFMKTLNQIC